MFRRGYLYRAFARRGLLWPGVRSFIEGFSIGRSFAGGSFVRRLITGGSFVGRSFVGGSFVKRSFVGGSFTFFFFLSGVRLPGLSGWMFLCRFFFFMVPFVVVFFVKSSFWELPSIWGSLLGVRFFFL